MLNHQSPLLVIYSNGISLDVIVLITNKSQAKIQQTIACPLENLAQDLPNLLQQIPKLPKKAIVITHELIPHLMAEQSVGLGEQIQDNIQWELEPLLSEQANVWGWQWNEEQALQTNWHLQAGMSELNETSYWVAGMNQTIYQQWLNLVESSGLYLHAIYPLIGSGLNYLTNDNELLLEIYPHSLSGLQRQQGQLVGLQTRFIPQMEPDLDQVIDLLHTLITDEIRILRLYITLDCRLAQELNNLAQVFNIEVLAIESPLPEQELTPAQFAMLALAQHTWQQYDEQMAIYLTASQPPPPWYQQPRYCLGLSIVAVFVAIALIEGQLYQRKQLLLTDMNATETELVKRQQDKDKIQALHDKVTKLKTKLQQQQQQLEQNQQQIALFDHILPQRSALVKGLLDAIIQSMNAQMVLDKIIESNQNIQIQAWSLEESSGQQFAKQLTQALMAWQWTVAHLSITAQTGRLDLSGYQIKLKLKPMDGKANVF